MRWGHLMLFLRRWKFSRENQLVNVLKRDLNPNCVDSNDFQASRQVVGCFMLSLFHERLSALFSANCQQQPSTFLSVFSCGLPESNSCSIQKIFSWRIGWKLTLPNKLKASHMFFQLRFFLQSFQLQSRDVFLKNKENCERDERRPTTQNRTSS